MKFLGFKSVENKPRDPYSEDDIFLNPFTISGILPAGDLSCFLIVEGLKIHVKQPSAFIHGYLQAELELRRKEAEAEREKIMNAHADGIHKNMVRVVKSFEFEDREICNKRPVDADKDLRVGCTLEEGHNGPCKFVWLNPATESWEDY